MMLTLRAAACGLALAAYISPLFAQSNHVHSHEAESAGPPSDESIYVLRTRLEAAGRGELTLPSLAGRPVVIAMFYSSCTSVCPLLTLRMQRIEAALKPEDRDRVQFVMVSLDAERDTPAQLAVFAGEHHLDASRWIIGHADAGDVRTLAAALGVRYRQLPDHSFSHSAVITLLDARGVPRARTQIIGADDPAFLASLNAQIH